MPTLIVTRDEKEIVCELNASWTPAEPQNNEPGGWDDVTAVDVSTGETVELTPDEAVAAEDELFETRRHNHEEALLP